MQSLKDRIFLDQNNKTIVIVILLTAIFVVSLAFALWATAAGIGVSPDSVTYFATANNLGNGNGFYAFGEPMTHFPPLYPLLLALSGGLSQPLVDSARYLNAILFALNITLFGVVIYKSTHQSVTAMLLGTLLFFFSKDILIVHAYALSEPLFLMFSLLSALSFSAYISSKKWAYLLISSFSLGLASATRYVGVAFLPVLLLGVFIFTKYSLKQKLRVSLGISLVSLFPLAAWMIRNVQLTQSAANRSIAFHPITMGNFRRFLTTWHNFPLNSSGIPWLDRFELLVIVLLVVAMIYLLAKKRVLSPRANPEEHLLLFFGFTAAFFYTLFIFLSRSFFDAAIRFDARMLLPAVIFMTISVFSSAHLLFSQPGMRAGWMVFILLVIFSIRINLPGFRNLIRKTRHESFGYNTQAWHSSQTLAKLKTVNPAKTVYSNGRDAIYFHLGINTSPLPMTSSPWNLSANATYDEELSIICDQVTNGEAVIVYFDDITWRRYLPTREEVIHSCHLDHLFQTRDGMILGLIH